MHGPLLKKKWGLAALVISLIAAHAIVFYQVISRMAWIVVVGLALLILLKHVGLLGSIYAFFKRRSWP